MLTEAQATRTAILNQLDQLAKQVSAESTVILYFSGHGVEVDTGIGKQYFPIPYGYDVSNLIATAISDREFMAKIEAIQAQKMLVLLDCCHASGIDNLLEKTPAVKSIKAPLPASAAAVLAKGRGRIITSSCKEHEKSYTGKPYSQFTQALLEALTGAGLSQKDGFVRATDLALYAAKTVPLHTQHQQNPDLHFAQADNFAVAYYAGGGAEPKGLPPSARRQGFGSVFPSCRRRASPKRPATGGMLTQIASQTKPPAPPRLRSTSRAATLWQAGTMPKPRVKAAWWPMPSTVT